MDCIHVNHLVTYMCGPMLRLQVLTHNAYTYAHHSCPTHIVYTYAVSVCDIHVRTYIATAPVDHSCEPSCDTHMFTTHVYIQV